MSANNGGPAFPMFTPKSHEARSDAGFDGTVDFAMGMTLRDYFAAKALVGFMGSGDADWTKHPESFAREAYRMADAMLAEREK